MDNKIVLENLYEDLEKYKNFDADSTNCERFLETVDQIVLKGDCTSIPVLFRYFDDNSEYSWVMEELMLSFENYKISEFLEEISKDAIYYWDISSMRISALFYRIVNSQDDFQELKQFIKGMEPSNSFIEILFKVLAASNLPKHSELLNELRNELNK